MADQEQNASSPDRTISNSEQDPHQQQAGAAIGSLGVRRSVPSVLNGNNLLVANYNADPEGFALARHRENRARREQASATNFEKLEAADAVKLDLEYQRDQQRRRDELERGHVRNNWLGVEADPHFAPPLPIPLREWKKNNKIGSGRTKGKGSAASRMSDLATDDSAFGSKSSTVALKGEKLINLDATTPSHCRTDDPPPLIQELCQRIRPKLAGFTTWPIRPKSRDIREWLAYHESSVFTTSGFIRSPNKDPPDLWKWWMDIRLFGPQDWRNLATDDPNGKPFPKLKVEKVLAVEGSLDMPYPAGNIMPDLRDRIPHMSSYPSLSRQQPDTSSGPPGTGNTVVASASRKDDDLHPDEAEDIQRAMAESKKPQPDQRKTAKGFHAGSSESDADIQASRQRPSIATDPRSTGQGDERTEADEAGFVIQDDEGGLSDEDFDGEEDEVEGEYEEEEYEEE